MHFHFCRMDIHHHQEQFEKCRLILQSISNFLCYSQKVKIWQASKGIVLNLCMYHLLGFQFLLDL